MDDIAEKRVFADRAGGEELLVAAGAGVVSASVSRGRVGRFGVVHRCSPTAIAAAGGLVAVATDEDVLLRGPDADRFEGAGFGPAVAVGVADGTPVAAAPDGRVAQLREGGWADLGRVAGAVRAIDGPLLAAADGVYRLPGLATVGLDDVRDVAAAGPLAATAGGLYVLGNGWLLEREGDVRVVAADGDRAHAATADALLARGADGWDEVEHPADGPVVAVAHGTVPYAVTADGTVLAPAEGGWRAAPLGADGVVGCAVA